MSHSILSLKLYTAIMLLDILVRFLPSQSQFTYNRSIFTPTDRVPISNGVEVWYGYYQSLRPAQGKVIFYPIPLHVVFTVSHAQHGTYNTRQHVCQHRHECYCYA